MRKRNLEKIIQQHVNNGRIENAYKKIRIGWHSVYLNIFTLKLKKIKKPIKNLQRDNAQLMQRIKKDTNLYKEIREYRLIFRFFQRLQIQKGEIQKSETPDFILKKDGKTYGIEVTRIYAGNDWIAEKLQHDIEIYRLQNEKLEKYIQQRKFNGKIKTYQTKKGIIVRAVKEKNFREEEITQIKNKLFEKIRKLMDDYTKYDYNLIFAEIVFTEYEAFTLSTKLNQEIQFFISHLDVVFGEDEFHLLLKIGNIYQVFDLKRGKYQRLD